MPTKTVYQQEAPANNSRTDVSAPKGKDNTLLYVAGGVGAAAVLYLATRPAPKKALNGAKKTVTTKKKKVKKLSI